MKTPGRWLLFAFSTLLPPDTSAIELRYTVDELHTTYWWREVCDFGCELESGGPVEATLQLPRDLLAINSLRFFVAGRSFTGCWVCVECCEGTEQGKKCHEDPPIYTWIAFQIDDPCGRSYIATHQPVSDEYWATDQSMTAWPQEGCPDDFSSLIGQEITITVYTDATDSSPCGYWNPDPSHEVVRFDVVLDADFAVASSISSWSLVKALYD